MTEIKLSESEGFAPTCAFRYVDKVTKHKNCTTTAIGILQQAWQGDKGSITWIDVPHIGTINE